MGVGRTKTVESGIAAIAVHKLRVSVASLDVILSFRLGFSLFLVPPPPTTNNELESYYICGEVKGSDTVPDENPASASHATYPVESTHIAHRPGAFLPAQHRCSS
jgi:hypothetical protein